MCPLVSQILEEVLRGDRILLKSEFHQKQQPAERWAAWPSFPKGVQRPKVIDQKPEP